MIPDDEDRYRAGVPAMSHAQYRAVARMVKRLRDDAERLEEREE